MEQPSRQTAPTSAYVGDGTLPHEVPAKVVMVDTTVTVLRAATDRNVARAELAPDVSIGMVIPSVKSGPLDDFEVANTGVILKGGDTLSNVEVAEVRLRLTVGAALWPPVDSANCDGVASVGMVDVGLADPQKCPVRGKAPFAKDRPGASGEGKLVVLVCMDEVMVCTTVLLAFLDVASIMVGTRTCSTQPTAPCCTLVTRSVLLRPLDIMSLLQVAIG